MHSAVAAILCEWGSAQRTPGRVARPLMGVPILCADRRDAGASAQWSGPALGGVCPQHQVLWMIASARSRMQMVRYLEVLHATPTHGVHTGTRGPALPGTEAQGTGSIWWGAGAALGYACPRHEGV